MEHVTIFRILVMRWCVVMGVTIFRAVIVFVAIFYCAQIFLETIFNLKRYVQK